MTLLAFTYPLKIDGATVAEFDGSVSVVPVCNRRPDPDDGWRLTDWSFEGVLPNGKRVDVPIPDAMRRDVEEWLEANMRDQLCEALAQEIADRRERDDEAREEFRDRQTRIWREIAREDAA